MKKLYLILMSFCVCTLVNAQVSFVATPIDNGYAKTLGANFRDYSLYSINVTQINRFIRQQQSGNIQFNLQLPGYYNWHFAISPNDILSNDYTMVVNTASGPTTYP